VPAWHDRTHVSQLITVMFPPTAPLLQRSLATYDGLYQQYASLASSLGQEPDIHLSLDPHQQITDMRTALTTGPTAATAGGGRRKSSDTGGVPVISTSNAAPVGMGGGRSGRQRLSSWSDVTYLLGNGGVVTARDGSDVPQQVTHDATAARSDGHMCCHRCSDRGLLQWAVLG
jgi:hypothetical protein